MAANDTNEDREGMAAEYVLGTLPPDEKREAEHLIIADPEFRQYVQFWHNSFSPLLEAVPPQLPPPGALGDIMQRIDRSDRRPVADNDNLESLNKRLTVWRRAAVAASFMVVFLASAFVGREITRPIDQKSFVAVLETEDRKPAFVASIDVKKGVVHVIRVGSAPQQDKSFELWAIGAGREKPESLGVVEDVTNIPSQQLGGIEPDKLRATTFAVSLEPLGGSPTGEVTGPVLFTGKLLPLTKDGNK